jgi:Peptidase family M28
MPHDAPPARSRRVLALASVAVVLVGLLSFVSARPPAPRGLDAATADFSALRARTHLEVIARVPHPVGSPAHDEVRAYIVRVLDELGLKPQIQEATSAMQIVGSTSAASIKNVVARLRGTNGTGRAVMLAAHYDSVPESRGASDDGSGVATLLETARALASSPAPANDVLFLFTDGEEIGLLGAQAFVDSNPAAKDVGVALNFDARGASGVVAMYDTSRGNGALVAALAHAAPRVTSTSLFQPLARLLPNDTDATIFANAGMATYAFAYVDDLFRYHQQTDSIDALDLGSLQHDGDYALPLARALANGNVDAMHSSDTVYFDLLQRVVVRYPPLVARLFALATLAFLVWTVTRAVRDGAVTAGGVASGVGRFFLAIACIGVITAGAGALFAQILSSAFLFSRPKLFFALLALVAAALVVVLFDLAIRSHRWRIDALGALVVLGVALGLTAAFAPGASYLFEWPLLGALVGARVWLFTAPQDGWKIDLASVAALAPAAFFGAGLTLTLVVTVGPGSPAAAPLAALPFALLAVPALARTSSAERRRAVVLMLAAALGVAVAIGALGRRGGGLRRADSLVYALDADTHDARWLTYADTSDAFVSQRVPEEAPWLSLPAFSPGGVRAARGARAAPLALHPAEIDVEGDETNGDTRHLTLRVRAGRFARCVRLWDDGGAPIVRARFADADVRELIRFSRETDEKLWRLVSGDDTPHVWRASYCAIASDGVELELFTRAGTPVRLRVVEVSDGLPDGTLAPRDPSTYPTVDSDVTLVSSASTF